MSVAAAATRATRLTKSDYEMFARFRVSAELLESAHVERVTDEQARNDYYIGGGKHGSMAGLVFPYFLAGRNGHHVTLRLRRDHPEIENGKPKDKYLCPWGDPRHLYFPPGATERLNDPGTAIIFVEAEKSALALTAWAERNGRNILAIATGGCWGWRGRIGKTTDETGTRVDELGPLADLDCARGRKCTILFDANTATNPKVDSARFAFAHALRKIGATAVATPNLPMSDSVNGPDDFLAVHGDEALTAVFGDSHGVCTVEDICALKLPDMPATVFAGRLGEICKAHMADFPIAYAWPALLICCAVLVRPSPDDQVRTNLNVGLVGPVHSGKSCAFERAAYLTGIEKQASPPLFERLKSGSAEGLMRRIGDRSGKNVLLYPDELSHIFGKMQIQNSSFSSVLNTAFYNDKGDLTVAKGHEISFHVRLSIGGGIVDTKFDELFGEASVAGLYDRFLFGQCPTNFHFLYQPHSGAQVFDPFYDHDRPQTQKVEGSAWGALNQFIKQEKLNPRVAEIGLRAAMICAAFDRHTVDAKYLEPFWELARYQERVRLLLQPNTGKNFEAQLANRLVQFLTAHGSKGQALKCRDVMRAVHASDYGPVIVERVLKALQFAGEITLQELPQPSGQRVKTVRLEKGVTSAPF